MPGRGTEIGTIRWCNTPTAIRSVFVLHGQLLILLEYQKTQRATQRAFYVVRALPPAVGQLLFRYLAFVRPFAGRYLTKPTSQARSVRTLLVMTPPERLSVFGGPDR